VIAGSVAAVPHRLVLQIALSSCSRWEGIVRKPHKFPYSASISTLIAHWAVKRASSVLMSADPACHKKIGLGFCTHWFINRNSICRCSTVCNQLGSDCRYRSEQATHNPLSRLVHQRSIRLDLLPRHCRHCACDLRRKDGVLSAASSDALRKKRCRRT
jgi:hypothetical protein